MTSFDLTWTGKENFRKNLAFLLDLYKKEGKPATVIAKEIGVSPKKLSSWKNGDYKPSDIEYGQLFKYFGISEDTFFTMDISTLSEYQSRAFCNVQPVNAQVVTLSAECQELVRLYNNLPVKMKIELIRFAYELTDKNASAQRDENIWRINEEIREKD